MPLTPKRKLVLKKLRDCFPDPGAANDALHSLEHYESKLPGWTDSVHLALIKLSNGELWRLRDLVKTARKNDPRDILMRAYMPEYCAYLEKKRPQLIRGFKTKQLSPEKRAAMKRRDQEQWQRWLEADGDQ